MADTRGFAAEILLRRGGEVGVTRGDEGLVVDQRSGITYVTIPAGRFRMGSDKGASWERPVHEVQITRPFLLAKYPVTNAQYARFLKAMDGAVDVPRFWEDGRLNQPEQPVVGVSWNEARAFCEWVGGRLPTEAEWEYACRAGTQTEYSFGDEPDKLEDYGWFRDNSGGQTQPVGSKKPNRWGLHDMHGNVWEWCSDGFAKDYYEQFVDQIAVDPTGPERATSRAIRGGSWWDGARDCRAAYRYGYEPGSRGEGLGFRVAAVPLSPVQPGPRPVSGAGSGG